MEVPGTSDGWILIYLSIDPKECTFIYPSSAEVSAQEQVPSVIMYQEYPGVTKGCRTWRIGIYRIGVPNIHSLVETERHVTPGMVSSVLLFSGQKTGWLHEARSGDAQAPASRGFRFVRFVRLDRRNFRPHWAGVEGVEGRHRVPKRWAAEYVSLEEMWTTRHYMAFNSCA